MVNKFLWFALFVVIFDRISKSIVQTMDAGASIPVIKNVLHLTYVHNTGAGFGILNNKNFLLLLFSLVVLIFVVYYFVKERNRDVKFMFIILASGIVGNVIDRISFGYVIDFIDFRIWPVFNIADIAIFVSIVGLVVYEMKKT